MQWKVLKAIQRLTTDAEAWGSLPINWHSIHVLTSAQVELSQNHTTHLELYIYNDAKIDSTTIYLLEAPYTLSLWNQNLTRSLKFGTDYIKAAWDIINNNAWRRIFSPWYNSVDWSILCYNRRLSSFIQKSTQVNLFKHTPVLLKNCDLNCTRWALWLYLNVFFLFLCMICALLLTGPPIHKGISNVPKLPLNTNPQCEKHNELLK